MAILVHFKRNRKPFDYVENSEFDTLIAHQAITAFKRESGWVVIGKDPTRRLYVVNHDYKGPERRASLKK